VELHQGHLTLLDDIWQNIEDGLKDGSLGMYFWYFYRLMFSMTKEMLPDHVISLLNVFDVMPQYAGRTTAKAAVVCNNKYL
jgi:hypothetical protein